MRALALCLALLGAPLHAQSVTPCDWQASAQALVEPWEENTKQFGNGAVRLAALDTIEPAVASAYLLVLSPPLNEIGERQCRVVGFDDQMGFAALYFDKLTTDYDPATGLIFELPVQIVTADLSFSNGALLSVTLNQSSGDIGVDMTLGRE